MRDVKTRTLTGGLHTVSCKFLMTNDDMEDDEDFSGSINSTVSRLLEFLPGNPTHFDIKIEHPSLRYNQHAFYIKFNPNITDVGYMLFSYLFNIQQSSQTVFMDEVLDLTLLAF